MSDSTARIDKYLVLYVDDDESNRELMAKLFARYRPHDDLILAGSVREAIEQARDKLPHLVVLDLTLPDGSGEDVLRILKAEQDVPVIIFSGHTDEATLRRLNEQGADAYITKPIDFAELLGTIESLIEPHSRGTT